MGLEEFGEDYSTLFCKNLLNLTEVLEILRVCEHPDANLHSLDAISINFLGLVSLEESTDDQDRINCHLVVLV